MDFPEDLIHAPRLDPAGSPFRLLSHPLVGGSPDRPSHAEESARILSGAHSRITHRLDHSFLGFGFVLHPASFELAGFAMASHRVRRAVRPLAFASSPSAGMVSAARSYPHAA